MNLIKYLLSSSYRKNLNKKYTKEICDRFLYEENQQEEIYALFLSNSNTNKKN